MWFKKRENQLSKYWQETFNLLNWFRDFLVNKNKEELEMLSAFKSNYISYIKEELLVLENYKQGLLS